MLTNAGQAAIRDTHFRSQKSTLGIELLTIESLFSRFSPDLLQKFERIHFYLILLFTQASGRHWIDFVAYDYNEMTMLFISKGQVQRFEVNSDAKGYLLLFTPEFLYENATALNIIHSLQIFDYALHSPKIVLTQELHAKFVERFVEIGSETEYASDVVQEEIVRHLLRVVLLSAERIYRATEQSRQIAPFYQRFVTFRDLVQQHLSDEHSAQFYAHEMSISPRQLNELTRQVLGKTAKAYIEEQIILEAQRLLAQGSTPIKEIAYGLGFTEPTNMVKFFKKHTRVSPSAFRQKFLAKNL